MRTYRIIMGVVLVVGLAWQADAAARCAKFAGRWEASLSGTVVCSVSPSVVQRFSFVGPKDVVQRGCRFSYSDIQGQQRGRIRGRNIKIAQAGVHPAFLNLHFIDRVKKATGRGRIQGRDRANVRISALLTGEFRGNPLSCKVKWTTRFVRLPPIVIPPPPPPRPPGTPPFDVPCCFFGRTVTADYHWPRLGSILYSSGAGAVDTRPGFIEFPNIDQSGIEVDFLERSFRITYRNGFDLSTVTAPSTTFDGMVIEILSFGERFIGVSLAGTNIPGYDGTQLSFDEDQVFVNQLGFTSFPPGSFIDVNVHFQ